VYMRPTAQIVVAGTHTHTHTQVGVGGKKWKAREQHSLSWSGWPDQETQGGKAQLEARELHSREGQQAQPHMKCAAWRWAAPATGHQPSCHRPARLAATQGEGAPSSVAAASLNCLLVFLKQGSPHNSSARYAQGAATQLNNTHTVATA
jgi:hypothetical protein